MTLAPQLTSSARDNWRTPQHILELVREVRQIGLDPCPDPENPAWVQATFAAGATNGLDLDWTDLTTGGAEHELVYCNPPYGHQIADWTSKAVVEAERGCEIVMLVPARVDTMWFAMIWHHARAICFIRGRLTFEEAEHPAPFPSALAYWGKTPHRFARACEDRDLGQVVML